MWICIVDADDRIREMLTDVLTDQGYASCSARNGQDARDILQHASSPPALIILDDVMPVMSGWEFLALRERDAQLRLVPVILLTTNTSVVDGHNPWTNLQIAQKPIDLDLLCDRIAAGCATSLTRTHRYGLQQPMLRATVPRHCEEQLYA